MLVTSFPLVKLNYKLHVGYKFSTKKCFIIRYRHLEIAHECTFIQIYSYNVQFQALAIDLAIDLV